MAPLRNVTCERSGSFRAASPPASGAGWARAVAAPTVSRVARAKDFFRKAETTRRPRNAAVARQVRIMSPPIGRFQEYTNVFRYSLPTKHLASEHACAAYARKDRRNSEHASTAKPTTEC